MIHRGSTASNAALTSAAQASAMITGGLLAVLIAIVVGNDARTDGFFAAFGVYSTIVARLLEGRERFSAFDHYLGAALLILVVVVAVFGPLGGVVARLLTGDLPPAAADTARTALLVLCPAVALQLFAALGAAMLGALDDFLSAGLAFVGGSIVSIVAFLLLEPVLGIDALAAGLLVGSVLSAAIVGAALIRNGWRPSTRAVAEPREVLRAAEVLLISSVSFMLAQIGFLVMLSAGARLGVGVVTSFTYAYMAMGLLQAVFVSSIPMVLAAPLARTWDRRPASLVHHNEAILRAGLVLVVPTLAAAATIGDDVGRLVLASFTEEQVALIVELFLILSLNVVWGLAATVPYAAVVAMGRYRAIAIATAGVLAVQVALSLVAAALDSVQLLAAVTPASTTLSVMTTFLIVSPRYLTLAGPRLLAILLRLTAVGVVAFGAPAAGASLAGLGPADWAVFLVGLGLFVGVVATVMPAERAAAERLATVLPGLGGRTAHAP